MTKHERRKLQKIILKYHENYEYFLQIQNPAMDYLEMIYDQKLVNEIPTLGKIF